MSVKTYSRLELAQHQLESAIGIFVSGGDRFSVISLAGAADVIFSRLLITRGIENFTELSLRKEHKQGNKIKSRESHGKELNDTLFINHLKHMDEDDDGFIELDPEECALAAILKAVANFVSIAGKQHDFIQAFFVWMRLNLDPEKYNIKGSAQQQPDV